MKNFLLIAFCAIAVQLSAQELLPQWTENLITQNPGVIDSIYYYKADPKSPDTRTYVIYYHQPLVHGQQGSEHYDITGRKISAEK